MPAEAPGGAPRTHRGRPPRPPCVAAAAASLPSTMGLSGVSLSFGWRCSCIASSLTWSTSQYHHCATARTQAAQAVAARRRRLCAAASPPGPCSATICFAFMQGTAAIAVVSCAALSRSSCLATAIARHRRSRLRTRRLCSSAAPRRQRSSRRASKPLQRQSMHTFACFIRPKFRRLPETSAHPPT